MISYERKEKKKNWNLLTVFWACGGKLLSSRQTSAILSQKKSQPIKATSQWQNSEAKKKVTTGHEESNTNTVSTQPQDARVEIMQTKGTAPVNLWYREAHVCLSLAGLLDTELMSLNVLWLVPFTAEMVIEHRQWSYIWRWITFPFGCILSLAENVVTLCHEVFIYQRPNECSKSSEL